MESALSLADRLEETNLPDAIKRHLLSCLRQAKCHRWHDALDENFDRVIKAANTVIRLACENAGRDQDTLIGDTDFNPNDLDPDRLDAAIGELRGINLLRKEGFEKIELLGAQPGSRTADLVAERQGVKFAIDVACSSANVSRSVETLVQYMVDVCQRKESQLNCTKAQKSCDRRGVVFVINSEPALVFGYQPLYLKAARDVYRTLGSPNDYHVVILTGRVAHVVGGVHDYFEGPDDVVYPSWPVIK